MIEVLNWFLHLDAYLASALIIFGNWVYVFLFLIIFIETGIVLAPFLPGDSLLFAAGGIASLGYLNIALLFALMFSAAVLGDSLNYYIGARFEKSLLSSRFSRYVRKDYLDRTNQFYSKYGGKTIILARFIPILRTFAPFTAGMGKMHYGKFLGYNIFGGLIWVSIFLFGGYFFGNIPFIQNNFSAIIIVIILVSFVPILVEIVKMISRSRKVQN